MKQFFKNNWIKILIGLVFICLIVFVFYLFKQNDENRKFIDYQKSYIENINKEPAVKNQEVISQPVVKDNTVEIEKCRASSDNISSEKMQWIVDTLSQIYQSDFSNIKQRSLKLAEMILANPTANSSIYKTISDNIEEDRSKLLKNQEDTMNQMIKQAKEDNYLRCLNNIQ